MSSGVLHCVSNLTNELSYTAEAVNLERNSEKDLDWNLVISIQKSRRQE